MIISDMINRLRLIRARHGDIEVTCTGCLDEPTAHPAFGGPYETTCEELVLFPSDEKFKEKRVTLFP